MIRIIVLGKTKEQYMNSAVDEYLKRLTAFTKVEIVELKEEKIATDELLVKQKEAGKILSALRDDEFVIVLDEIGTEYTSPKFAEKFKHIVSANPKIAFVIGGALGLHEDVRLRADLTLALSQMTLTHQMIRLLLVEQIYRAYMINTGRSYHK